MTIRYGQSGYVGFSRSIRATLAEEEEKLPLTRAIPIVAKRLGVSHKVAREAIKVIGPCEAHHTSKYANLTDYYDINQVIHDYQLSIDPLGEEVKAAEENEAYGYDGWRWLSLYEDFFRVEEFEQILNSTKIAYELGLLSNRRMAAINLIHESRGCKIQHSCNFRQWETALRRLTEVRNGSQSQKIEAA